MRTGGDVVAAIRADLTQLLSGWRGLVFAQRSTAYAAGTDQWRLDTPWKRVGFGVWSLLGAVLLPILYPFVAFGFWVRYVTRRIDRTIASLGILAVVGGVAAVWTGLTVVAWARFQASGFQAVLAASLVATASVGLSWAASRTGSRPVTLLVAYPFAVSAVFLPPVTAALYSPVLGSVIIPESVSLANWLLRNPLRLFGVSTFFSRQFTLTGLGFLWMWLAIAIPTGWVLGALVTAANAVRPGDGRSPGGG